MQGSSLSSTPRSSSSRPFTAPSAAPKLSFAARLAAPPTVPVPPRRPTHGRDSRRPLPPKPHLDRRQGWRFHNPPPPRLGTADAALPGEGGLSPRRRLTIPQQIQAVEEAHALAGLSSARPAIAGPTSPMSLMSPSKRESSVAAPLVIEPDDPQVDEYQPPLDSADPSTRMAVDDDFTTPAVLARRSTANPTARVSPQLLSLDLAQNAHHDRGNTVRSPTRRTGRVVMLEVTRGVLFDPRQYWLLPFESRVDPALTMPVGGTQGPKPEAKEQQLTVGCTVGYQRAVADGQTAIATKVCLEADVAGDALFADIETAQRMRDRKVSKPFASLSNSFISDEIPEDDDTESSHIDMFRGRHHDDDLDGKELFFSPGQELMTPRRTVGLGLDDEALRTLENLPPFGLELYAVLRRLKGVPVLPDVTSEVLAEKVLKSLDAPTVTIPGSVFDVEWAPDDGPADHAPDAPVRPPTETTDPELDSLKPSSQQHTSHGRCRCHRKPPIPLNPAFMKSPAPTPRHGDAEHAVAIVDGGSEDGQLTPLDLLSHCRLPSPRLPVKEVQRWREMPTQAPRKPRYSEWSMNKAKEYQSLHHQAMRLYEREIELRGPKKKDRGIFGEEFAPTPRPGRPAHTMDLPTLVGVIHSLQRRDEATVAAVVGTATPSPRNPPLRRGSMTSDNGAAQGTTAAPSLPATGSGGDVADVLSKIPRRRYYGPLWALGQGVSLKPVTKVNKSGTVRRPSIQGLPLPPRPGASVASESPRPGTTGTGRRPTAGAVQFPKPPATARPSLRRSTVTL